MLSRDPREEVGVKNGNWWLTDESIADFSPPLFPQIMKIFDLFDEDNSGGITFRNLKVCKYVYVFSTYITSGY